jgi:hypothetical protein
VADGAHVTLVTCTRGELGEVIPPDLAHLAADRQDVLGEHRVGVHEEQPTVGGEGHDRILARRDDEGSPDPAIAPDLGLRGEDL